ncbi:hypothetical protein LTR37_020611 [Vermiconidia calcicola]|uniref:Uncharacterized protein n=1 Tax=Vermiconidia calcicola TaxID=1690605 RepID=A0ACC3MAR3_9PEZI|nr:hypothetical protein LTR37_020611 [Vermiconidia calcicola]
MSLDHHRPSATHQAMSKPSTPGSSLPARRDYLLRFPPELRLTIYDALLQPLLQRPSNLDSWAYRSDFKKLDLSPYTNLLATCTAIQRELQPHFEQNYLTALLFHFEDVPSLHLFCRKLSKLGAAYQDVQILLRTPVVRTGASADTVVTRQYEACHGGHDYLLRAGASDLNPHKAALMLNGGTFDFIFSQPGIPPLCWSDLAFKFHRASTAETPMLGTNLSARMAATGAVIRQGQTEEGLPVDVLDLPVSLKGDGMQVYVRQLSGRNDWTAYLDTRVRIKDIDWANFGAKDREFAERDLQQWRELLDERTRA